MADLNVQLSEFIKLAKSTNMKLANGHKKNFITSIELARAVRSAHELIKKPMFIEKHGQVKVANLAKRMGFSQSQIDSKWFNKLSRVGHVTDPQIEAFISLCKKSDSSSMSIATLEKWLKAEAQNEGEGEGEGNEAAAQAVEKNKPIISFTCRLQDVGVSDRNLSLRVDKEGKLVTANSVAEIRAAIRILEEACKANLPAMEAAEATKPAPERSGNVPTVKTVKAA